MWVYWGFEHPEFDPWAIREQVDQLTGSSYEYVSHQVKCSRLASSIVFSGSPVNQFTHLCQLYVHKDFPCYNEALRFESSACVTKITVCLSTLDAHCRSTESPITARASLSAWSSTTAFSLRIDIQELTGTTRSRAISPTSPRTPTLLSHAMTRWGCLLYLPLLIDFKLSLWPDSLRGYALLVGLIFDYDTQASVPERRIFGEGADSNFIQQQRVTFYLYM